MLNGYLYGGAALMVMAFAWKAYDVVYDRGYRDATTKQQQLALARQNQAIEKARETWEATAKVAEKQIIVEEKIVEKIRVVEKEIPKVVDRIVQVTPECNDLGVDFLRLYNAAIDASNNREDSRPDLTAESETRVF